MYDNSKHDAVEFLTPINGRVGPSVEIGSTGLRHYGGYIDEEFLPVLRFPNCIFIYKEMYENDTIVHAILYAIEMLIRSVKWKVEAADDSNEAHQVAEFIDSCFHDMEKPFKEVISEIVSFLTYGFSVNELVYKRRFGQDQTDPRFKSRFEDGLWGWRKISIRSQDTILRWDFGYNNELLGLYQFPPLMGTKYIPRDRFLLFRVNSKKDNPESTSILRHAYRAWFYKKRIEEIEAIGIERDLAGLPIGTCPQEYMAPDAPAEQKAMYQSLKNAVSSIRQNQKAGLILPSNADEKGNLLFDFKLLSSPGQKQIDTNVIITRYNSNIAQSVLADFIMLGQQSQGSYALSKDKTELFALALEAWVESIQEEFNMNAIPKLLELNNISTKVQPRLSHTPIEMTDLAAVGSFFRDMISVGAIDIDSTLQDFLRKLGGAPLAEVDDL